jgi:hypothetical protein
LNLKVLFLVFLCLFSASIICNMAVTTPDTAQEQSGKALTYAVLPDDITINRTEPVSGDPIGGGWP